MKPIRLLALSLVTTLTASAQTNSYPFPASGNVGIGTTDPQPSVKLDVRQWGADSFAVAGYVYDGTGANTAAIHGHGYAQSGNGTNTGVQGLSDGNRGTGTNIGGYFSASGAANNYALITASGNVGVGTATPGGKLQIFSEGTGATKTYSTSNGFGLILDQYYSAAPEAGSAWTRTADIVASTGDVSSSQIRFLTKPAYSNPSVALLIGSSGSVGIGTTNPTAKLTVKGGVSIQNGDLQNNSVPDGDLALPYGHALRFANDSNNATLPMITLGAFDGRANTLRIGTDAWPSQIVFRTGDLYSPQFPGDIRMVIANSGNVGIGTTNPAHKLAVNGTIKAKEVIVETTGWSDYVLAKNYKLLPLSEVETHINANGHLPGIPSAAQVAEQGVSVGDMQARLLAKIEELTLHQIAQEKELAALRTEVRALRDSQR